ncbi:MAG: hypothetical protein Q4D13_01860 [Erysipelotrichaceae bacterium]|nr:hypothetical protein [Erysipelotrichaceae bacterium]
MMNSVNLRFYVLKNDQVYEVSFDTRISFKDNMGMLKVMEDIVNEDMKVYDNTKGIFLRMDVPLKEMEIECFTSFYLL